jgi:diguanylate cyclase (GGDEF)-like protein/PAS domain S-box-containing protein/putative nucleotidyltransferase with HDIG domain
MPATPNSSDAGQHLAAVPQAFVTGEPPAAAVDVAFPPAVELKMAQSRLGIVYGLYLALRAKHPPTAMHSLRVALSCSKWAAARNMPESQRDLLEVAALLHDLGKLGIPDRVLQKSSSLVGDEQALMELHVQVGLELLRGAGAAPDILEIIASFRKWCHLPSRAEGADEPLPLAARMIAIVDAFDSMTSEQVFRRALSRERAVAELFENAGTQFDAELVKEFATLIMQPAQELEALLVRRWLSDLRPLTTPGFSEYDTPLASGAVQTLVDTLYHRQLLDAMNDAAVYVDCAGRILHWNRSAERMTGQNSPAVIHQVWTAELMGLRDEAGSRLSDDRCPMREVFTNRVHVMRRAEVSHRDGRVFKVNLQVLPVINSRREFSGAILLVRDSSIQVSLEQRVRSLHERATRDPLTGISNRAELDRRLSEFVPERLQSGEPGSLIICDIDHFKNINDTFGHQVGDEALVVFASILEELARETDMVARYGGEEFVVMCGNCDNATATARAEEMRRAVEHRSLPSLRGASMTASFGVTEVQAGDTDETFLARADRALLLAKQTGRNRVVQLGSGQPEFRGPDTNRGWRGWFRKRSANNSSIIEREFLTAVPVDVAVEKLNGFINDHKATILSIEGDQATLQINTRQSSRQRRQADRPARMIVVVQWSKIAIGGRHGMLQTKTRLKISVASAEFRDRRMAALLEQAMQVMHSLVAYLGAQELDAKTRQKIVETPPADAGQDP